MSTLMGPGGIGVPMFGTQAATKTEQGYAFPRAAFAYVPSELPRTWGVRLWETPQRKETPRQLEAAVASLSTVPTPDLPVVIRRVVQAWQAINAGELPAALRKEHDAVAPPGWEHSLKRMKKHKDISNPWALSWWLKNRGAKPSRHEADMSASADDTSLLKSLVRQQRFLPPICIAAARGEAWAQAQLLSESYPPLVVEGRW